MIQERMCLHVVYKFVCKIDMYVPLAGKTTILEELMLL